jgi:Family of unknown function (DUF6152)
VIRACIRVSVKVDIRREFFDTRRTNDMSTASRRQVRMATRFIALAVVITSAVAAAPASAHHSDVAYDQEKVVQLKSATVISYQWRNPHGVLVCEFKDDTGALVRWTLETGSPASLTGQGWNRNSVVAGDVVTIDANPARNGTRFGRLLAVTKADGTVLRWRNAREGVI